MMNKISKPRTLGINYISLMGYNVEKVGNYVQFIREQQKETALQVLSQFCSGDYNETLKVIAN